IGDMELREEWQDDGFPRYKLTCPSLSRGVEGVLVTLLVRINILALILFKIFFFLFFHIFSVVQGDGGQRSEIHLSWVETPSFLRDTDDLPRTGKGRAVGVAWSPAEPSEGLMELDQVDSKGRRWRRFRVSGHEFHVNMSVLEPYLQVLSHGGYYGDGMNAIILFTSCYLPENTVEDYGYVMENLFRYIVGTLDLMVSENYMLVYLCSLAPRNKLPTIKWLHQCYTSIDRRLKKDLKGLLVVHPAWYIKALLTLVKPFISDKFSKKITFIHSLQKLSQFIPTERLQIPEAIRQ
uniref:BCL2 interacting protein like n=1 Tax=Oryzias latipes TaxID=8090 RepID=A0A3B3IN36_ORYLA